MDPSDSLAELDAARAAIADAERELRAVVQATPASTEKVVVTLAVRRAFSKLRAAQAKLAHLEDVDRHARLAGARARMEAAERKLDRLLREPPSESADKEWISEVVEQAFADLREARNELTELGKLIAPARR